MHETRFNKCKTTRNEIERCDKHSKNISSHCYTIYKTSLELVALVVSSNPKSVLMVLITHRR